MPQEQLTPNDSNGLGAFTINTPPHIRQNPDLYKLYQEGYRWCTWCNRKFLPSSSMNQICSDGTADFRYIPATDQIIQLKQFCEIDCLIKWMESECREIEKTL